MSTQLTTEIVDLSEASAQLQKAVAEATELQMEEKAKSAAFVADATGAQAAVDDAQMRQQLYELRVAPSLSRSPATRRPKALQSQRN